jgi:hypothetical protein
MFAPMVLDSSNKGDECASAHPLRKNFARAQNIAAEEFAHHEGELHLTSTAGNISQTSAVGAMNRRRGLRTKWTTRRRVRGDHRNEQAGFGDLNLIDQHPFRKWQKWCPIHHNLAFQAK